MKIWTVLFYCMLLICSVVMAHVTGTDDFNDSAIDTDQWDNPIYIGNPGFAETNGHLHFYTQDDPGTNAYHAVLPWKVTGPFSEDWEAQVSTVMPDFVNDATQQYDVGFNISVNNVGELYSNRVSFTASNNESNQKKFMENFVLNNAEIRDVDFNRSMDATILRIRWDAASSNLYSEVSDDGGTTWTNYWSPLNNPFNMTSADDFVCTLYAASKGRPITLADNLYFDDFQATIYSGPLNGFDDFNDNRYDSRKWLKAEPMLTETNNRLEFTSRGIGDENGTWVWIKNAGSYTQDWSAAVDAYNDSISTNQWSFSALAVVRPSEDPLLFTGIAVGNETGRYVYAGWNEGEAEYHNGFLTTNVQARFKVEYDAMEMRLSAFADLGNGYISLTNRSIEGVNSLDKSMLIGLSGSTEGSYLIHSGEMYFDNFEVHTHPTTPAIFKATLFSNQLFHLSISNLALEASNTLERTFDLMDSNGWHTATSFISSTTQTNINEMVSNAWDRAFYRIISQ